MEIIGVKVVVIIFCVFMTYFSFLCYKKDFFGIIATATWIVVFAAITIATVLYEKLAPLSDLLQFSRILDFFVTIGLLFLIAVSFTNFLQNQKLKKKIEKLVQDEALK